MVSQKVPRRVISVQAGIYKYTTLLDPRLRGDDNKERILTFYESVKVEFHEVNLIWLRQYMEDGPVS